jgi:hypothetical protein
MVGEHFLLDLHNMGKALTINATISGMKTTLWGLFERFFAMIIKTFIIHFKPRSSMIGT